MNPPIRKPICPTFIHDDTTRLIVCVIGSIICFYICYKMLNRFNK